MQVFCSIVIEIEDWDPSNSNTTGLLLSCDLIVGDILDAVFMYLVRLTGSVSSHSGRIEVNIGKTISPESAFTVSYTDCLHISRWRVGSCVSRWMG